MLLLGHAWGGILIGLAMSWIVFWLILAAAFWKFDMWEVFLGG